MAVSFQLNRKSLISCPIHRDDKGCLYIDMDGYIISFPHAKDYCDVVEHLIIIEECFEKGFQLEYE